MASQSLLIKQENTLIAVKDLLLDISKEIECERTSNIDLNRPEIRPAIHEYNRDVYGTMLMNMLALRTQLDSTIADLQKEFE